MLHDIHNSEGAVSDSGWAPSNQRDYRRRGGGTMKHICYNGGRQGELPEGTFCGGRQGELPQGTFC